MNDFHVHTLRSSDSEEPMAAYIPAAKEAGVKTICFTDHVDFNPHDTNYQYYEADKFFKDLEAATIQAGKLELLAGIEFGEPHLYAEELANLKKLPYDFIMGSVHYTNRYPKWFFSRLVKNGISAEDCFEAYWDSILECVSVGGFDCLGHIDIPKRYYKALFYSENKLRLIFRRMLDNGIILEINTSSLAKGVDEPMPGRELLELYKSEGGRYITIGSDAHAAWQLIDSHRAFHAMAQSLANSVGLTEVTYKNRKIREAAQ